MWPQFFEIALGYPDRVVELTVPMSTASVTLSEAVGLPIPDYILFNSSGQGYGLFPVEQVLLRKVPDVASPLMRASAYVSLYENMLNKERRHYPCPVGGCTGEICWEKKRKN